MNKQIISTFVLFFAILTLPLAAQNTTKSDDSGKVTKLFRSEEIIPVKISYSNKEMKKKAGDTTFIATNFEYLDDGEWKTIELGLRGRGNFRLENCYFPPIKVDIDKSNAKGTIFKGNKKLKMVLPCFDQKGASNKVIKEYMAYKMYEALSPYHFKTRLMEIDLNEVKGKKLKNHKLKGFLIEDDKVLAKRHNGNRIKDRKVHPMAQDTICSVRNAFFQYMIGNTDYSVLAGHNEKLLFVNKEVLPVPYDFDMSGLVYASYSTVSEIKGEVLPISSVKERLYRGFKRSDAIFEQMRQEYLSNKEAVMAVVDACEPMFDDQKEFDTAKTYISNFFGILQNKDRFNKLIVRYAREN